MTEPKTNSEFDYSDVNVMAIGVMAAIAIMIFFFLFWVAALLYPCHNLKQVIQFI